MASNTIETEYKDIFIRNVPSGDMAFLRMADVQLNEEALKLLNYSVFTIKDLKRTLYVRLNGPNSHTTREWQWTLSSSEAVVSRRRTTKSMKKSGDFPTRHLPLPRESSHWPGRRKNFSSPSCCYTRSVRPSWRQKWKTTWRPRRWQSPNCNKMHSNRKPTC